MKINYIRDYVKIDIEDKRYPQRLLKIKDIPLELYALGNLNLLNAKYTAGIIGCRDCTNYGRKVAKEFAKEMSGEGICIISGMALGVDAMAHEFASPKQGKTIAVLGGGFNHIYPEENEWLFYKIIDDGGCIISEYPPNIVAEKDNFPRRNRIVSGLSDALLVVEAKHRSGCSITVKHAYEQGKTVFAIPNSIYEKTGVGTNTLIQNGAILATKSTQIINVVKHKKSKKYKKNDLCIKPKAEVQKETNNKSKIKNKEDKKIITKKEYLTIYKEISNSPMHINEIAIKLNKSIQEITPTIIMMEIDGYIEQVQTNYFKRSEDKI